ncbi:MAG: TIGR02921 family PEP-CTERM protein [Myxococcota bacterium]
MGAWLAEAPRAAYVALMHPFSYHPVDPGAVYEQWGSDTRVRTGRSLPKDAQTATELYADVFDSAMSRAERDALLASATQTWSWRDVQAGLLSVGERKVRLASQEVTTEVHGDLATVRIHDVWRNQGFDREEILLAFDLPDSAAITGLWMGPDPDVAEAFAYIVAPRGAAQEVYESEVQRRVDPALLESVGPRQYRLRAFPVEPRDSSYDSLYHFGDEGPDLHVWMELVVPVVDGVVATPVLDEARNAFWDGSEARTVDGWTVASDTWVSPVAAAASTPRQPHEAVVSGFRVTAEPARATPKPLGRVDVVIDGSASMRFHREDLAAALRALDGEEARIWCVREGSLQVCDDFDPATAVFWGHASVAEQIAYQPWTRDALVVLTDPGSYELVGDLNDRLTRDDLPPLWLVHLGGFPSAYPDWTLDRITQSGGGIAASVDELRERMADPTLVDGWRFTVEPAGEAPSTASSPFDAIAARAAIRSLAREQQGADLRHLDALHALAVENHVVSPWSSMIVLVDQAQKDRLKEASEADDRFEREGIDQEGFTDVSATPEPGTWLLLVLGGGLLAGTARRQQDGA